MADGLSRLALGRLRLRAEGRQDAFGGSLALATADRSDMAQRPRARRPISGRPRCWTFIETVRV